jgi:hypothetical protein
MILLLTIVKYSICPLNTSLCGQTEIGIYPTRIEFSSLIPVACPLEIHLVLNIRHGFHFSEYFSSNGSAHIQQCRVFDLQML